MPHAASGRHAEFARLILLVTKIRACLSTSYYMTNMTGALRSHL